MTDAPRLVAVSTWSRRFKSEILITHDTKVNPIDSNTFDVIAVRATRYLKDSLRDSDARCLCDPALGDVPHHRSSQLVAGVGHRYRSGVARGGVIRFLYTRDDAPAVPHSKRCVIQSCELRVHGGVAVHVHRKFPGKKKARDKLYLRSYASSHRGAQDVERRDVLQGSVFETVVA